MKNVTVTIDDGILRKARQYAGEHDTILEALIVEHMAVLADRAGRRLTLREQTYVDHRPPEEVTERLRAEGASGKRSVR